MLACTLWLTVCLLSSASGLGRDHRHSSSPRPNANKVVDVKTSCDHDSLHIGITMYKPFKGLVFAKEFSRECRTQGNLDKKITLTLPSNACGVRTTTRWNTTSNELDAVMANLYYTVELVVQMDRQLQQSSDQELLVKCRLRPRALHIRSPALDQLMQKKLREITGRETKKMRSGRTRQDWVGDYDRELLLEAARAWMQLSPIHSTTEPATVEVGQTMRLLVQCTLPIGVGLRVTNCVAHDGLGEASQKLLDEAGCPIDETIFTKPTIYKYKAKGSEIEFMDLKPVDPVKNLDESSSIKQAKNDPDNTQKNLMTYQHAVTTFAAFKFPDRAKLHLTCGIELCKDECPPVDCKALQKPQTTREGLLRKARLDKDAQGIVIDRLEVYNSIEVLAPNIELEDEASIRGSRQDLNDDSDEFGRGFSPGDKTICLSPGKMALAFCILGIIFLCALAIAFASLVRARRRLGREPLHTSLSFYTGSKSFFSSSDSSTSGLSGSKLLLTDSPYLDQHSSSSNNWPYSRAF